MDASPLPIVVPSGPPTNVPSAPPATGSAFRTTPLRTPPTALSDRRAHDLADRATNLADKVAEELIQFLLVRDREQFGRHLKLVGLAEHFRTAFTRPRRLLAFERFQFRIVFSERTRHDDLRDETDQWHACTSLRSILARSVPDAATRDLAENLEAVRANAEAGFAGPAPCPQAAKLSSVVLVLKIAGGCRRQEQRPCYDFQHCGRASCRMFEGAKGLDTVPHVTGPCGCLREACSSQERPGRTPDAFAKRQ